MTDELFDVVEVDIESGAVTMMTDAPKDARNADAIERMAILRRSTDSNFFTTVPAGKYSDGDTYSYS